MSIMLGQWTVPASREWSRLLGVAVLSRVLADHPDLRQRLLTAIVPRALELT